jgi:hypothetical protein
MKGKFTKFWTIAGTALNKINRTTGRNWLGFRLNVPPSFLKKFGLVSSKTKVAENAKPVTIKIIFAARLLPRNEEFASPRA